jgi:hypothetical protein
MEQRPGKHQTAATSATPSTQVFRILIPAWFVYMLVALPVFGWMIFTSAGARHPWMLTWFWVTVALNYAMIVAVAFLIGRDRRLGHNRSLWVIAEVFTGALGALIYWWRYLRDRPR